MPASSLRAENSELSLLVEALRCAFRGARALFSSYVRTLPSKKKIKTRALYMPCSTVWDGAVYALRYCMRWRCMCMPCSAVWDGAVLYALQCCMRWRCIICPAVLYEILALLTGYCIGYTVRCIYLDYSIATVYYGIRRAFVLCALSLHERNLL